MPTAGAFPSGAANLRLLQPPVEPVPVSGLQAVPSPMTLAKPRQFYIQGVTIQGRTFRPSDWAERLAGAMSSFRPGGSRGGISAYTAVPSYQASGLPGVGALERRGVADVAFNADPETGQYTAVRSPGSSAVSWVSAGGTSSARA